MWGVWAAAEFHPSLPLHLQLKAWCYYESRLLGAHHGLISSYALEVLVLYIFNLHHAELHTPLDVSLTCHVHVHTEPGRLLPPACMGSTLPSRLALLQWVPQPSTACASMRFSAVRHGCTAGFAALPGCAWLF